MRRLGLFVIVATPGWQFWSNEPAFEAHVVHDIRQMVRRDRNHPSVIMWEPILNETSYPDSFGKLTWKVVHEEYAYQGAYTASDTSSMAQGYEVHDIHDYGREASAKSSFVREFGDNVDDFGAQNSNSRAAFGWGERPQLKQALHYHGALNWVFNTNQFMTGGALWCTFDHQRGYHNDPFYGGIMDAFRRKKTSFYYFASQRDPKVKLDQADSGPLVHIAHELTPFSGEDIVVFTNCEEVRLSMFGRPLGTRKVKRTARSAPHPPVIFENAYSFQLLRKFNRNRDESKGVRVNLVAEGLIGGEVVARDEVISSRESKRIVLEIDDEARPLVGDGSDFVPVIAKLVDQSGNVKRLSNKFIFFDVQGEGSLIGDASNGANPVQAQWGSAPALVRATTRSGKIRVTARVLHRGEVVPTSAEIEFESIAASMPSLYSEIPVQVTQPKTATVPNGDSDRVRELEKQLERAQQQLNTLRLDAVRKAQESSPADR